VRSSSHVNERARRRKRNVNVAGRCERYIVTVEGDLNSHGADDHDVIPNWRQDNRGFAHEFARMNELHQRPGAGRAGSANRRSLQLARSSLRSQTRTSAGSTTCLTVAAPAGPSTAYWGSCSLGRSRGCT
jgi:hypothetical protein